MTTDASRRVVSRLTRRPVLCAAACVPLSLAGVCWWLAAPLGSRTAAPRHIVLRPAGSSPAADRRPARPAAPRWPETRLEGLAAKRLLLDLLNAANAKLSAIDAYTATLRKRERIDGILGPGHSMEMKVRHAPFSVYLKYRGMKQGREVVYTEGKNENKLIAHSGGWSRRLVPRLALAPTDPLALRDTRHPITDIGLANLTRRLIDYRKLDLNDPEAATILDRATDTEGRTWLRSVHTHPRPNPDRPFARVEVRYDPVSFLPRRIENFDWPRPDGSGEPELAESYAYDDLNLDADLTDLDFDPGNPAYAFARY